MDKNLKACLITIAIGLVVAITCLLFMGCAGNAVRPNCSDDSIVAATIFNLRTGHRTYIQKSVAGDHAQAYAVVNGKHVPLHVFPVFAWYVLPSVEDELQGGRGQIYTVDEFIKRHGPWKEGE